MMRYIIKLLLLLPVVLFSQDRPNIIFLNFDDMGRESIESNQYGTSSPTQASYSIPYMQDSLLQKGEYYTNFHVTPICTPTRIAWLTGKYQYNNMECFAWMHHSQRTFAHDLKFSGYNTSQMGKWHMSGRQDDMEYPLRGSDTDPKHPVSDTLNPIRAGFDDMFSFYVTNTIGTYDEFIFFDEKKDVIEYTQPKFSGVGYGDDVMLDTLMKRVTDWQQDSKPFLIYASTWLPHTEYRPLPNEPDFPAYQTNATRTPLEQHGKYLEYVDDYLSRFIGFMEDNNYLSNTVVIITADNGTWRRNNENSNPEFQFTDGNNIWDSQKHYPSYNGGNVPLWVLYDGANTTVQKGNTNDRLIQAEDIYSTVNELARTGRDDNKGQSKSFADEIVNYATGEVRQIIVQYFDPRTIFNNPHDEKLWVFDGTYALDEFGNFYDVEDSPEMYIPAFTNFTTTGMNASELTAFNVLRDELDNHPKVQHYNYKVLQNPND
ncbi:MAG: sulfatase-like hydrolase/transferase [Bacteroidota bacterium]